MEERIQFLKEQIKLLEDQLTIINDQYKATDDQYAESMLCVYHGVNDKLNKYKEELEGYQVVY